MKKKNSFFGDIAEFFKRFFGFKSIDGEPKRKGNKSAKDLKAGKDNAPVAEKTEISSYIENEEETVAVISAAVYAYLSGGEDYNPPFRIKNIRRIY